MGCSCDLQRVLAALFALLATLVRLQPAGVADPARCEAELAVALPSTSKVVEEPRATALVMANAQGDGPGEWAWSAGLRISDMAMAMAMVMGYRPWVMDIAMGHRPSVMDMARTIAMAHRSWPMPMPITFARDPQRSAQP